MGRHMALVEKIKWVFCCLSYTQLEPEGFCRWLVWSCWRRGPERDIDCVASCGSWTYLLKPELGVMPLGLDECFALIFQLRMSLQLGQAKGRLQRTVMHKDHRDKNNEQMTRYYRCSTIIGIKSLYFCVSATWMDLLIPNFKLTN